MAGIGIKMERFFKKQRLISSHVAGSAYSVLITLAPMLLVILTNIFDAVSARLYRCSV